MLVGALSLTVMVFGVRTPERAEAASFVTTLEQTTKTLAHHITESIDRFVANVASALSRSTPSPPPLHQGLALMEQAPSLPSPHHHGLPALLPHRPEPWGALLCM